MSERRSGVGDRLKWLRQHGPLTRFNTVKEMCKRLDLKNSTWYDWIGDRYYPKGPIIAWLEHEGVNLKWLKTGLGNPYVINPTPSSSMGSFIKTILDQHTSRQRKLSVDNLTDHGIYYVSWPNDEALPQVTGDFWNLQEEGLLAVTVEGDAMDGVYPDAMCAGDTVLVRLGRDPKDGEIWVIRCRMQGGIWSNWRIRKISLLSETIVFLQPYHVNFKGIEMPHKDVQFLAKIEYKVSRHHYKTHTTSR